jgi:hypothetical protein
MSLKILPIPPVPEETARSAHACLPHGTLVVQVRDTLGVLYSDDDFADLFPARGQPAEAPWRLAFGAGHGAAIPGGAARPASRGCGAQPAGLDVCPQLGGDRSRLRSPAAYGAVCVSRPPHRGWGRAAAARSGPGAGARTRLAQTAGQATDGRDAGARGGPCPQASGVCGPDAAPYPQCTRRGGSRVAARAWATGVDRALRAPRTAHRVEEDRLPSGKAERERYANLVGADGWRLLDALDETATPAGLRDLSAVQTLRRVWAQQ